MRYERERETRKMILFHGIGQDGENENRAESNGMFVCSQTHNKKGMENQMKVGQLSIDLLTINVALFALRSHFSRFVFRERTVFHMRTVQLIFHTQFTALASSIRGLSLSLLSLHVQMIKDNNNEMKRRKKEKLVKCITVIMRLEMMEILPANH